MFMSRSYTWQQAISISTVCAEVRCSKLYRSFAQRLGRVLGRDGVDVEASSPFKTRHLGQFGDHLDMPVVKLVGLLVERRGVQDEVEGGLGQDAVHPSQGFRETGGQQLAGCFLTILKVS